MVTVARTGSQILLHMGVAFSVMWAATGSLAFGGIAAVVEPICNIALLPLHDRLWARIQMAVSARQARCRAQAQFMPGSTLT